MDRKDTHFWYSIGAEDHSPGYLTASMNCYAASLLGDACRRAFIAGCIARAFGVDLAATL